MSYAFVDANGTVCELDASKPLKIGGVQYVRDIYTAWTAQELAAIGVYQIQESDVPQWKAVTSSSLTFENGIVVRENILSDIPVVDRQAQMCEMVRARRYAIETAGVAVQGGAVLITDRDSQAKITGAVALFENDQTLASIDWEAQPGVWVSVDREAMLGIGVAVGRHVQQCYSHSRQLIESITAASSHAELDMIDIAAGWPAQ